MNNSSRHLPSSEKSKTTWWNVSDNWAFLCSLYGKHNMHSADTVCYVMFQYTYAPRKLGDPLRKIKGVNTSSMPPCISVLTKIIKRANYVPSYGKMLYDQIQLAYLPNQTSTVRSWLVEGTQSTGLVVNSCHAISARFSVKMIQSSHQKMTKKLKCHMDNYCTVLMNRTLTMMIGDKHTL